jgi:hypothetical protein
MSTLKPDTFGGQIAPSKTSVTQLRVADAFQGLAPESNDYEVIGNVQPGSLQNQPNVGQVEVPHGTTAVTAERHMSTRASGFNLNLDEPSVKAKELANMSSIKPVYTPATTGFVSSTIVAVAPNLKQITLQNATSIEYKSWLLFTFADGKQEDRFVRKRNGNSVELWAPLSKTPALGSTVTRIHHSDQAEAGSDFRELIVNLKTSTDDQGLHLLHYDNAVVVQGTNNQGSNSQVMGVALNFAANAQEFPHPETGVLVPKFSNERIYPPDIARTLS